MRFIIREIKDNIKNKDNDEHFERSLVSPFEKFHCINPLPGGTSFHIDILNKKLRANPWMTAVSTSIEGVILTAEYSDSILQSDKIKTIFYWNISDAGQLLEIDNETYKSYRKLLKSNGLIK